MMLAALLMVQARHLLGHLLLHLDRADLPIELHRVVPADRQALPAADAPFVVDDHRRGVVVFFDGVEGIMVYRGCIESCKKNTIKMSRGSFLKLLKRVK